MSEINANEIFAGLYDEIFLQDIKSIYNDGKISALTKGFLEGKATVEEKKYFLKLRNQYLKVKNIKDYSLLQKKLYGNKSRREIISFEIARILNNDNLNVKISDQVADVRKLLDVHSAELTDELYKKIVNLIIRIEISLGMKIGLFDELCNLFEDEINKIEQELVVDTVAFSKKK